jgi:hypothetical protein
MILRATDGQRIAQTGNKILKAQCISRIRGGETQILDMDTVRWAKYTPFVQNQVCVPLYDIQVPDMLRGSVIAIKAELAALGTVQQGRCSFD